MSRWQNIGLLTYVLPVTDIENSSSFNAVEFGNCSLPAVAQFPTDLFTQDERLHGAIILHFIFVLYLFWALAIVCDEYFVIAMEVLCERLGIDDDVAGATFMAAGSSSTELFVSLIGVFIAKDDVGTATIVGSAVYNVLAVIGLVALASAQPIWLNWWPITRDVVYYVFAVIALLWALSGGEVTWYKSLTLLVMYIIYIIIMKYNAKADKLAHRVLSYFRGAARKSTTVLVADFDDLDKNGYASIGSPAASSVLELTPEGSDSESQPLVPQSPIVDAAHDETRQPWYIWPAQEAWYKKAAWILALPIQCAFYVSVPDCRIEKWRKWYPVTFITSVIWIAVLTYAVTWMVTVIGYTFGIPDSVMGVSFLAVGASVPDTLASVIVARQGHGEMAVANPIGSNIFDVLLGLALPWFLRTAVLNPGSVVQVQSDGLIVSVLMLFVTVFVLLAGVALTGWRLTKRLGVVLLVAYLCFVVLSVLIELNVFGYVNPPACL